MVNSHDGADSAPHEVRFEAAIFTGDRHVAMADVPAMDLDLLPSAPGEARVIVTADEAARLVERGFEVRLLRAHPIQPLDPALVVDEDAGEQALAAMFPDIDLPDIDQTDDDQTADDQTADDQTADDEKEGE